MTTIRIWIFEGGERRLGGGRPELLSAGARDERTGGPGKPRYRNTEEALREIVACFTEGYEKGLKAGHEPSSDWLMPAY